MQSHIQPLSRDIKVLVLENDASYASVCIKHLQLAGFPHAHLVPGTREAFNRALRDSEVDVVLSGYALQGWTGMDAYETLQSQGLDIPFVLMAESIGDEEAVACMKKGVADCLLKRNIARIGWVVKRVLNERQLRRERDAAIEDARRSERLYGIVFSETPLPKLIFDVKTLRFLAVNKAAIEHYGYSEQEFMRFTVNDLLPPGTGPLPQDFLQKTAAGKSASPHACRHKTKRGSVIDVEIYSRDIDFQGSAARLWTALDITDRKRMEDMLRKSEAFHRSIFERNIAAVLCTTLEGQILACNDAFVKIFGFSGQEEAKTHSAVSIYAVSEHRNHLLDLLMQHGSVNNLQLPIRRKDGTEGWMLLNASLLPDASGELRIIEGTMLDITHIRQFERRQRMDLADKIAAGVAHDFNNILMIMYVNSDILEQRNLCVPAGKEYLSNIRNAAERGQKLTQQLLTFSRKQVVQPVRINMNDLLREHINMLKPLLGEDIQLSIRPGADLPCILADPAQIEQVIMNLLLNARDAMPNGGKIRLETSAREVGEDGPSWMPSGKYVMVSVEDTGTGMDEETRSKIFEPFFTTKDPGQGTGLGLSVVYGIVKQSGAFMDIDTKPGRGTKFSISFPALQAQEAQAETPILSVPRVRGTGSILLVEDEDVLRGCLKDFLSEYGYRVWDVRLADEALLWVDQGEKPDLLITDVVMPGTSGTSLAEQLRRHIPELRVIYMSGYSGERLEPHLTSDGSIRFLQKPFSLSDLLFTVNQMLGVSPRKVSSRAEVSG